MSSFTCGACGETFEHDPDWDEGEAIAEHERVFGFRPEDSPTVCDDCYQDILAWAANKGLLT